MSTPVITKFSNKYTKESPQYLWVYADDEELSMNHPPVLDWQSGLENLEQLHTKPVKEEGIIKEDEDECECEAREIVIVEIEEKDNSVLQNLLEMLEKLSCLNSANFLRRFLQTKEAIYLKEAIQKTEEEDPVTFHKLCNIVKKAKFKKGY